MLVRFFKSGVGRGAGPVEYCVNQVVPEFDESRQRVKDANGNDVMKTREPAPTVMAGNPEQTIRLIDANLNKWKYTSGVIAFEDEDAPTEAEQLEVIADFEKTAFAGLDPDQYDILWIRHEHEGNIELHFVTPRLELSTGKALNIAPPGHESFFNLWRDKWNLEKNWANPDAPERAKVLKLNPNDKQNDQKELINDFLTNRVINGLINNRDDVIASLSEIGEITRQGKNYISVKPVGFEKPIRLRGVIYEQDFERAGFVASLETENRERQTRDREHQQRAVRETSAELERAINSRIEFNNKRYKRPVEPELERSQELDTESEPRNAEHSNELTGPVEPELNRNDQLISEVEPDGQKNDQGHTEPTRAVEQPSIEADSKAVADSCISLNDHLARELGSNALLNEQSTGTAGIDRSAEQNDREPETDNRELSPTNMGGRVEPEPERPFYRTAQRNKGRGWLDSWRKTGIEIGKKLKGIYDRARTTFNDWFAELGRTIQDGHEPINSTELALATTDNRVSHASREFDQAIKQLEPTANRAIGNLKMQRNDELNRFKTDINLVDYASSQGYEISKTESSKSSVVMKNGDDKIVIGTSPSNHGIYFSVRNETDNGSIIDFIQNRQGLNLGQIRKELRPWIGKTADRKYYTATAKPEASHKDRQQVLARFMQLETVTSHAYLENRGIDTDLLADARFNGMVKADNRGNAVFPHYDQLGLSGFELKNKNFTGFSKNGSKSVWHSTNLETAKQLVIVESAIDALSHAKANGTGQETAYLSVGGALSPEQLELVKEHIKGFEKVFMATDNDDAGHKLADQLTALAPAETLVQRETPVLKDWNDQLQADIQRQKQRDYDNDFDLSM